MTPWFSVVVPTYNRPEQLQVCLAALVRLDYPFERLEVIVVDDGSPTRLHECVEKFEGRLPVRLVRQENSGPAAARNRGAQAAHGELLAFTDDDCAPRPAWLRGLVTRLDRQPDALIGGRTLNQLRSNVCSATSQLLIDYIYEQWNTRAGRAQFFASNNMALRTAEFHNLGGFDTVYTRAASEDRELCYRWSESGRPLTYAPEAVITHFHALTPRSLWSQHFAYGGGAWRFYQARAAQGGQFFKPDPKFYTGLFRYPFSSARGLQSDTGPWLLSLMLVWTQVAAFAGFLAEKRRAPRGRHSLQGCEPLL